jgi:preprotein translocase subunit SecG
LPGDWTDSLGEWGSSARLGSIGNEHVLIAAATILSLAILLPASRDGISVFFGTDEGKRAFRTSLAWLIVTMMATILSTLASFVLLVASLWICLAMSLKALSAKAKADDDEVAVTERINALLLGRPPGKPAPSGRRCKAKRKSDGQQCMNTALARGRCGIHA